MKNLLLSSVAALALTGFVHAQSDNAMQSAVESGIAAMNEGGANISYDSSVVGDDNSLMFNGVKLAPEDGSAVITTDWVKLTPSTEVPGDITVTVAPRIDMMLKPEPEIAPVDLVINSEGLAITSNWVLGAVGKPKLQIVADAFSVTGGDPEHEMFRKVDASLGGLNLDVKVDQGAGNVDGSLSLATMDMEYDLTDPVEGYDFATTYVMPDVSVTMEGSGLPFDDGDPEDFLLNGGMFKIALASGEGSYSIATNDPEFPVSMDMAGGAGTMELSYLDGIFAFSSQSGYYDVTATPDPAVMPLPPFNLAFSGGSINVRIPVTPTENFQDLNLAIALRDLTVSDTAWAMVDPEATIPRDPATLDVDIAARVKLDRPLTEAEDTKNPMEMGQVDSINLNKVYLTVGGATLDAAGSATIDNDAIPFPMPNGAVDISVIGLQTLSQALVNLGLIDQMEAGMAMGMMMAFAKPVEGQADSFTSKVEFKDGAVLANGVPIQ